jgi:hypothetical protein
MANSYLTRTPSSGGNRKTFTISTWFKRTKLSTVQQLVQAATDGSTRSNVILRSEDGIQFYCEVGGIQKINIRTNRVFRDTNAWYHVVLAVDTTQGTASNRVKFYINGVQETSLHTAVYGDQNFDTEFNHTVAQTIGRRDAYSDQYFDGYQSHFSLVDGTALTPTTFGQTDSTSGIWKFKSPSGVTWGTNGVHLKFENSAALGTDSSGNTNTFTVNGNLKQALDTPSNVSVTMNPLDYWYRNPVLSIGNTKIVDTTGWSGSRGTFGFSTGKWYWEIKLSGSSMDNHIHGVQLADVNTRTQDPQQITGTTVFYNHDGGEMRTDGTQTTADYGTFSSGDIMGVAVDMTAGSYGQITIYKNGSAIVSNFDLSSSSTTIMPFSAVGNCTTEYNFGNGFFGTTAITSAGSNGNGSLFEYDVPSGHYALNTKNLNTYG